MKTLIFTPGGESFISEGEYFNWIITSRVERNLEPFSESEEKKKWRTRDNQNRGTRKLAQRKRMLIK